MFNHSMVVDESTIIQPSLTLHHHGSQQLPGASLVLAYVFGFMVLVSAYEAAARPKVGLQGSTHGVTPVVTRGIS